jgi:hypothetical protein
MNRELLARATFKAIDVQLDALRALAARMIASLGRAEPLWHDLIDDDPFLELLSAPREPVVRAAPAIWRAAARPAAVRRIAATALRQN